MITTEIGQHHIDINTLFEILQSDTTIEIDAESREKVRICRTYLEDKIKAGGLLYYGINTGFGALCDIRISEQDIEKLQSNIVQSHACGLGDEVPEEIVRIILLLKIKNLLPGKSGVRELIVDRLLDMYNNKIFPVIYQQGSLGASGDLAPLAHLSLPILGLGEVRYKNSIKSTAEVYTELYWDSIPLSAKEGLALLNGTQFSTAYAAWCTGQSHQLLEIANMVAALSIDAFDATEIPFHHRLHEIRGHEGQINAAGAVRNWLNGSPMQQMQKNSVQDPYSFRCVPQVHGASWDVIRFVQNTVETEMNAVTDNPNIFEDEDLILSGGNFHAQPIAYALDFLSIAISELASISERRTFQLISGLRGLPPFLTNNPGLHSGFMIPQYTAASIVSQNKQLCTPASVDSIVSSAGQEDHVSMAANAATKCYQVVGNVWKVLAIEWMVAAQAMHLRRPLKTSPGLENILKEYRTVVPALEEDRILHHDMVDTISFLKSLASKKAK